MRCGCWLARVRPACGVHQSFEAWLDQEGAGAIEASDANNMAHLCGFRPGRVDLRGLSLGQALALLSAEVPAFPDHLFALSGVSGGSVGTTLYANALHQAASRGRSGGADR